LIIRAVDPETRFYIHRLICSPYVQSYIKDKAVGDKDGFSGGRCKRILVPFPPLAEQQRIAQKIDEIMQVFEK
jgi:type I restriction enzyme S subunit